MKSELTVLREVMTSATETATDAKTRLAAVHAEVARLGTEAFTHLHGSTAHASTAALAASAEKEAAELDRRALEQSSAAALAKVDRIRASIQEKQSALGRWEDGRWKRAFPSAAGIFITGLIVLPDFADLMVELCVGP